MSQTNKNKTPISNYFTSEKLFHQQSSKSKRRQDDSSDKNRQKSPHLKYKYTIIKDLQQKPSIYDRKDKIDQVQSVQEHTQNDDKQIQRQNSPIKQQLSISHYSIKDSPQIAWQSQIVKSSRKYFDSCRGQATEYIDKLQTILTSDHLLIQKAIKQIKEYMEESYHVEGEKIKQQLYLAVDEAIERWKKNQIRKLQSSQMNYLGELLELNTQIQQRLKQMHNYKQQLSDEKVWKVRVSDLLTTSYEQDILQLTNLCQKSITQSKQRAQKISTLYHNNIMNKMISLTTEGMCASIQKNIIDQIENKSSQRTVQKEQHSKIYHRRDIFKQSTSRKSKSICESCSQRLK